MKTNGERPPLLRELEARLRRDVEAARRELPAGLHDRILVALEAAEPDTARRPGGNKPRLALAAGLLVALTAGGLLLRPEEGRADDALLTRAARSASDLAEALESPVLDVRSTVDATLWEEAELIASDVSQLAGVFWSSVPASLRDSSLESSAE